MRGWPANDLLDSETYGHHEYQGNQTIFTSNYIFAPGDFDISAPNAYRLYNLFFLIFGLQSRIILSAFKSII